MNLYLLRHGLAVEFGTPGYPTDADRPLTPKGEKRIARVAQAMAAMDLDFEVIFSSPYLRARQTAEIIADGLAARKRLEFSPALLPGTEPRVVLDSLARLKPRPGNVLLVGHEPNLSQLISQLTTGGHGLAVTIKKGALCKLVIEALTHDRCATLEWLVTPKQMALMA